MTDFGLAPVKQEGAAAHPDIFEDSDELPDLWYRRQLEAYIEDTGDSDAKYTCVRNWLWL